MSWLGQPKNGLKSEYFKNQRSTQLVQSLRTVLLMLFKLRGKKAGFPKWCVNFPQVRKWTREAMFEESKKYTTTTQFIKYAHRAYEKARDNGWLSDMPWLHTLVDTPQKQKL